MDAFLALVLSAAAFLFFRLNRRLASEQAMWFKTRLDALDRETSRRQAELEEVRRTRDGIRSQAAELRKHYQLVSRLAKTLDVEKECKVAVDFLKSELAGISGAIELRIGEKSVLYDMDRGELHDVQDGQSLRRCPTVIPLQYGDLTLGALHVTLPAGAYPAVADHPERLRLYAGQIQLTFATAILYEEARLRAITDSLTGTAARWYFDDRLEQEAQYAAATAGSSFGLIMIDIDHFKRVNDTHGHVAGDAILKRVAGALKSVSRDTDLVARYGGEEFAVIAPAVDPENLAKLAERLRAEVESLRVKAMPDRPAIQVTISAGAALWDGARHAGAADLLREADRKLYEAKNAGRNRWVI